MIVLFQQIIQDLQNNFLTNKDIFIGYIHRKNPIFIYNKIKELTEFVSRRYGIDIQLHFPDSKKIFDYDSYGTENIGIVFDKFKRQFHINREIIKKTSSLMIENSKVSDAYMYEDKEGVRVRIGDSNERIEILPGSVHFWCKLNPNIIQFADWLLINVYKYER